MRPFLFLFLPACLIAQAQSPTPVFSRESMRPFGRGDSKLLAPGLVVELYGQNLSPEPWCGQPRLPKAPYPKEICGVRVRVGSSPSELLFTGPGQINFKVPADAPAEGLAPVQVCVGTVCSAAVVMQFSAHKAFLTLERPASVHMPVWVDVEAPPPNQIQYPCDNSPWIPAAYEVEVRRNGNALAPSATPARPAGADARCSAVSPHGRLPLHLLYSFSEPGTYSARVTARKGAELLFQSDWTDITIEPYAAEKREEWLRSVAAKMKQTAAPSLARDVIPSLLAYPDEKALALVLAAIPADAPRCVNADCVTIAFARAALGAFDDGMLRRAVPAGRLAQLCPPEGKCR